MPILALLPILSICEKLDTVITLALPPELAGKQMAHLRLKGLHVSIVSLYIYKMRNSITF